MRTLFRSMLFSLLVGVLIFVGTCLLRPGDVPEIPELLPWDKVAHFGMFFLLSAVASYDYYCLHHERPAMGKWIFWGFLLPVIYGGIIELLQKYLFVSRSAEWADWYADIVSSLLATAGVIIFFRKRKK